LTRYSDIVQDHFRNPRHCGAMSDPDASVTVTNPVCGDMLSLYVRVRQGAVAEATFQAQGCPAALAAGSMTAVLLQGRPVSDLDSITREAVVEALGGLPRDKMHCSVLAEEAIAELKRFLLPEERT
jgi:nitrogen fixation NifU-like protein